MKLSSSSEVYSHSNFNKLSEHLFFTALVMYERSAIHKREAFLLGLCHDFGKLTSFFQREKIHKIGTYHERSRHSLISIHFATAFLDHCGVDETFGALVALFAVNHHSNLKDFNDLLTSFFKGERRHYELEPQIEDLKNRIGEIEQVYKQEIPKLIEEYVPALKEYIPYLESFNFTSFLRSDFLKKNKKLWRTCQAGFEQEGAERKQNYFVQISYLYALLIFADRNMAAKLPDAYKELSKRSSFLIDEDIIEKEVRSFGSSKDDIRQRLFDTLETHVQSKSLPSNRIFSITAPTGTGKTLASLNFAFKLAKRTGKEKIIYALPMTNIIEQNYETLRRIFSQYIGMPFKQNEFSYLIKHHYLADYHLAEETDVYQTLKSVEAWNAQVIVTTFIQLFYAFANNEASYLYRFPALQNSVLIFDEPQVLNPQHWLLIRKILLQLVEHFSVYIILMTATKPLIFEQNEAFELTKQAGHEIHFGAFITKRGSRHKLVPHLDKTLTLNQAIDFFIEKIEVLSSGIKRSVLIVMNTKKSSVEVFKQIRQKLPHYMVYYLSTNLTPFHRKEVIAKVHAAMQKENVIVVSTQVIEAGVDLDFNLGFRDLSPLDSIIQTAGRINRHFQRTELVEPLYVVKVKKDENAPKGFGEYVYDNEYLRKTESLLTREFCEHEFESIIDTYFKQLKAYNALSLEKKAELLDSLNFQMLAEHFQIIEKNDYTVPVFLEVNDQASHALEKFHEKQNELDDSEEYEKRFKLKKELQYIQRQLYQFIVNVNAANKATDNWLTIINQSDMNDYYDFDDATKIGMGIDEVKMGLFS